MGIQLFALIRTKYNILSKSQKTVADYILNNPEKVILNTLNETATVCDVSETTVLRFLRKIGFNSYQLFRINLTQQLSSSDTASTSYEDVKFGDLTEQVIEKIVLSTTNSIKASQEIITAEIIDQVVDRILTARKIVVIGVGASGSIASDFFHKLLKLGMDVVYNNDAHIINMLSINLQPEDLLIVYSHSGESREVLDAASLAKENGCDVCAITSYARSTLANCARYVISSSSLETKLRSDAMISRIIQMVITDIIYVSIIVRKGDAVMPQIHNSRLAVAKNKI